MKKILKNIGKIKRFIIGFFLDKTDKLIDISKISEKILVGKSIKGKDLNCFKIGNGNKKVLYVSGIHGNEVGTVKLAHKLINFFNTNISKYIDYTFFIISCLNIDGYDKAIKNPDYFNGGKVGRFNSNEVDLNRNFPTKTFTQKSIRSFGKNYSQNVEVFCGKEGNSETETKALTEFIKSSDIKILFVFHNAGKDVLGNSTELSQKISKLYSEKTGFKLLTQDYWKTLKQTGTAKEWCDENDITYLEIEGTTRYGSDWNIQKNAIIESLKLI
ncbi:MAG: M14 family zinc carboxypeptidase [Candidatus Gracilibacteria bacterium]|nr:M14 family zinc carboxypeptidase [Candidatus Gracilibacteria bacterium]